MAASRAGELSSRSVRIPKSAADTAIDDCGRGASTVNSSAPCGSLTFTLLAVFTAEPSDAPRLADELEMHDFLDRRCDTLSTGMKQKTSIARTLIHDPAVMIFDEPTLGLDVLVARSLLDTVKQLRDQGKCIIFSTHIMREAERLCDQIAIISRGRILDAGTLPELRDRHAEQDLEELFFRLIEREESRGEEVAKSKSR
jgi:ABC-type multidrug transport system ATPase subunit